MEQVNSNGHKKVQQLDIFKKYAKTNNTNSIKSDLSSGELALSYNDFIRLISNSQRIYAKFTDHSFNLNQVPTNTFGCIFFALDEHNKGYLTINDWFHFNNILECNNYNLILLYEFFRKFDIERFKAQTHDKSTTVEDHRIRSINYSDRFLSFDDLLLNVGQFKETVKLLQDSVKDDFVKDNKLFLDWNSLQPLKLYEKFPYGGFDKITESYYRSIDLKHDRETDKNAYISLNSLVTVLQNDLKNARLHIGFDRLARLDPIKKCFTLNKNQLAYLLRMFYSHRVTADIFESVNFSNSALIRCNNQSIPYSVYKDIFYLFQNFDLLNQVLIKYATVNELSEEELREQVVTKENLMGLLNSHYNKINNITLFSPSQINLLFSIVANSKRLNRQKSRDIVMNSGEDNQLGNDEKALSVDGNLHQVSEINNFLQNEYGHEPNPSKDTLELFNVSYNDISNEFIQDSMVYKNIPSQKSTFFNTIFGRNDVGQNDIDNNEFLTVEDFMKILNPNYLNDVVHQKELRNIQNRSLYVNYYFYPIFDSIYNFCLGSVAGCIGATVVYPIDFIKTRMQAQRSVIRYKNSIDCFVKVFRNEGIRGLYSGLGFQLIGVAPEKAIKLTVNDIMRNKMVDNQGRLSVFGEILSGSSAGACQVIFTNPIEIVKIRLQVKSEYAVSSQLTALQIIRKLGLTGLYRGVVACLMRDVPFSAIYFPTYAHLKKDLFQFDPNDKTKRNRLKTWELLLAGGLAGMPAAFLTTPFDVVKTRLQIEPKAGETRYNGIFHAFKTILREERFRSFFKGGGARVLRSSPQFGFTLAAYELFKNMFPLPDSKENSPGNGHGSLEFRDIPSVNRSLDSFFKNTKTNSAPTDSYDFFSPTVDPYSSNYLNYYYKSCEIAKTFIDLENNFSKFDETTYSKFYDYLKSIDKE